MVTSYSTDAPRTIAPGLIEGGGFLIDHVQEVRRVTFVEDVLVREVRPGLAQGPDARRTISRADAVTQECLRDIRGRQARFEAAILEEMEECERTGQTLLTQGEWTLITAPLECAVDLLQGPNPQRIWRWQPLFEDDPRHLGQSQGDGTPLRLVSLRGQALWDRLLPEFEQAWLQIARATPQPPLDKRYQLEGKGASGVAHHGLIRAAEVFVEDLELAHQANARSLMKTMTLLSIEGLLAAHSRESTEEALWTFQRLLGDIEFTPCSRSKKIIGEFVSRLCALEDFNAARGLLGRLMGLCGSEAIVCRCFKSVIGLPMDPGPSWTISSQTANWDVVKEGWKNWLTSALRAFKRGSPTMLPGEWSKFSEWVLNYQALGADIIQKVIGEIDPIEWLSALRDCVSSRNGTTSSASTSVLKKTIETEVQKHLLIEVQSTERECVQSAIAAAPWLQELFREWIVRTNRGELEGVIQDIVAWQQAWHKALGRRHQIEDEAWVEYLCGLWAVERLALEGIQKKKHQKHSFLEMKRAIKPLEKAISDFLSEHMLGSMAVLEQCRRATIHWLVRGPNAFDDSSDAMKGDYQKVRGIFSAIAQYEDEVIRESRSPIKTQKQLSELLALLESALQYPQVLGEECLSTLQEIRSNIMELFQEISDTTFPEDPRLAYRKAEASAHHRLQLTAAIALFGPQEAVMLLADPQERNTLSQIVFTLTDPRRYEELVAVLIQQSIEFGAYEFVAEILSRMGSGALWMPPQVLNSNYGLLGLAIVVRDCSLRWAPLQTVALQRHWIVARLVELVQKLRRNQEKSSETQREKSRNLLASMQHEGFNWMMDAEKKIVWEQKVGGHYRGVSGALAPAASASSSRSASEDK